MSIKSLDAEVEIYNTEELKISTLPDQTEFELLKSKIEKVLNDTNLIPKLINVLWSSLYGWGRYLPNAVGACMVLAPITNPPFIIETIRPQELPIDEMGPYKEIVLTRGNLNLHFTTKFGARAKTRAVKKIASWAPKSQHISDFTDSELRGRVVKEQEKNDQGEYVEIVKVKQGLATVMNKGLLYSYEAVTSASNDSYRAQRHNFLKEIIEDGTISFSIGTKSVKTLQQISFITCQTKMYEDSQLRTRLIPIYPPESVDVSIEAAYRKCRSIISDPAIDGSFLESIGDIKHDSFLRQMYYYVFREIEGMNGSPMIGSVAIHPTWRLFKRWLLAFSNLLPGLDEVRKKAEEMDNNFTDEKFQAIQVLAKEHGGIDYIDGSMRVLDDAFRVAQLSCLLNFKHRKFEIKTMPVYKPEWYKKKKLTEPDGSCVMRGVVICPQRIFQTNDDDIKIAEELIDYLMEKRTEESLAGLGTSDKQKILEDSFSITPREMTILDMIVKNPGKNTKELAMMIYGDQFDDSKRVLVGKTVRELLAKNMIQQKVAGTNKLLSISHRGLDCHTRCKGGA